MIPYQKTILHYLTSPSKIVREKTWLVGPSLKHNDGVVFVGGFGQACPHLGVLEKSVEAVVLLVFLQYRHGYKVLLHSRQNGEIL